MTELAELVAASPDSGTATSAAGSPPSRAPLPPPTLGDAAGSGLAASLPALPSLAPTPATPAPTTVPAPPTPPLPDDAETPPRPTMTTGPAAILAPDAVAPLDASSLTLPETVAKPSAAPATQAPSGPRPGEFAFEPLGDPLAGPRVTKKKRRRGGRALLTLILLGGMGAAGAVYGPELYEEYLGDGTVDEPEAPMAFPVTRGQQPVVRSATFVLEGIPGRTAVSYTVQTDFEAPVARVLIDRVDDADLEVLTFVDDAFVRRTDDDQWYQLDRGEFPLEDQLAREDWVRFADELFPATDRRGIVIDAATASEVDGIPARRLTLTLPATTLIHRAEQSMLSDPMAEIAALPVEDPTAATTVPGSEAAPPPDATTDAPATPAPAPDASAEPTPAPAEPAIDEAVDPTTDAGPTPRVAAPDGTARPTATPAEPMTVDVWIDDRGVVRRIDGAPGLGAASIRVLATSPDPWVPDYPDLATVQPLTASALIELGL